MRGDRLLLNGQPIHLKGFGRHEDFPVHGRGLDLPVLVRDHALLKWVGANSYRTSHYPYSDEAMALADKEGFLIIDEIPAVGLLFDDGERAIETRLAICKQQVSDLIARDKNHPSVIMWSVANEPASRGALRGNTDSGLAFFTELLAHARAQDRTRPALLVGEQRTERSWVAQSDVITVNRYWGWYILPGQIDKAVAQLARELDELHAATGKPVIIAEFGADAVAGSHSEPPQMWTEEYQTAMLKAYLDLAATRPWIVGLHVWNFADFKTGQGTHRALGINHKGVFTRDRQPKMAARFLRSQWAGGQ